MIYSKCQLTDNGWLDSDTGLVIQDISGMDNKSPGQRFYHAGKTGYPDVETMWCGDYGTECLCISDSLPANSTELTKSAFIIALNGHGFGDSIYIGIDGAPHNTGDDVAELPDVSAENTKIIIDAHRKDNLALLRETIDTMQDGQEKLALQSILTILEEDIGNG